MLTLEALNYITLLHDGEIWWKLYGPNYTKFWTFWQKMVNHFWQSVDAILDDVSVTEMLNY